MSHSTAVAGGGADIRYGFANGRIRSLETSLLDRPRYERLIRVSDSTEFRAVLADTAYGRYLGEGDATVDGALVTAGADNFAFLAEYCQDSWLLRLFRIGADIHNLAVLLKSRRQDSEPAQGLFFERGEWGDGQLRALSAAEAKAEPDEVRRLVGDIAGPDGGDFEPARVDAELDKLAQRMALRMAEQSGYVAGFLSVHADVVNLGIFVRARLMEEDRAVADRAYLAGGELAVADLSRLYVEDWDALLARLRMTPYGPLAEGGIGYARERGSTLRLERLGREQELVFLRQARYLTFGYEPLVCYFLFRENELRNLRQLHAAKQAGLEEAVCRELIAYIE